MSVPETDPISAFIRGQLTINPDGSVNAPKNIIQNITVAREQYQRQRIDHLPHIQVYAAIEGQIAGNPPYDQAELDAHGLGHKANYNNYKARSHYERAAQLYWNLINATEVFLKIRLAGNAKELPQYARIIARHFNDVIREWEDFYNNINLLGAQLTKFGWSPLYWPDENSWMWETVDVSKCFLPSQTSTFNSKLTTLSLESLYTIQDLYTIYEKSKTRDKSPWNTKALGDYLIRRAQGILGDNSQVSITDPMALQRFVQSNSATVNRFFNDNVRLINMFQQEYEGGVSHYILDRDFLDRAANANTDNPDQDFLFFIDRQYKTFQEAFVIFTTSPGEWEIFSSLGVGQKSYSGSQAVNMLDCTIVDMSIMSSTPLVRSVASSGREISPIRFYPGVPTDIGAAEFVQNDLGKNINQLVLASNYIGETISTNAANSGDDPATPDAVSGSVSPTQFKLEAFGEFGVSKIAAAHFYNTWDRVIFNMFLKALNAKEGSKGYEYVQEWKDRCLDDGVPEQLFDTADKGLRGLPRQFRKVSASRVAGDGSVLARILGIQSVAPIASSFNANQMNEYKREVIETSLGVDALPAYTDTPGMMDENSGGASLATAENFMISQGAMPMMSPDNDQEAHANIHMQELMKTQEALTQQQISPIDADKIFSVGIPHMAEHMKYMQGVPLLYGKIYAQLEQPFGQLVKLAQLNRKNAQAMIQAQIRQQQEDQAATQEVMSDAERKDFVAQRDVARKDGESAAKQERAEEQSQLKGDLMRDTTNAKIESERQKTAAKVAKEGATAKGASNQVLAAESPEQLSQRLTDIAGKTPSTQDFA